MSIIAGFFPCYKPSNQVLRAQAIGADAVKAADKLNRALDDLIAGDEEPLSKLVHLSYEARFWHLKDK